MMDFFMKTKSWAIQVPRAFFTRTRNDKFLATWWGFGTVKVFHGRNIQNSSHNRFLDYIPACCVHVCGCYSPVCCSFLHAHFNIFVFTNRHSLKSVSIESFWRMLAHPQATLIGGRVQKVTHLLIVDFKHTEKHLQFNINCEQYFTPEEFVDLLNLLYTLCQKSLRSVMVWHPSRHALALQGFIDK